MAKHIFSHFFFLLLFWDAAVVWEAFTWNHHDDEAPPARTMNSLNLLWVTTVHSGGCNSIQAHYADRARGTEATVAVCWFFFPRGIKANVWGNNSLLKSAEVFVPAPPLSVHERGGAWWAVQRALGQRLAWSKDHSANLNFIDICDRV